MIKKISDDKKQAFFAVAKLLSSTFGIVPLMYGSLGLEYLMGKDMNADDIDILIPNVFLSERWQELQAVLEGKGYVLIDEHEHTFEKEGVRFSYAQMEELECFAEIGMAEIATVHIEDICFKLLSLPQYLKVYTASLKDGYRVNVRGKKDADKIALIQQQLRQEK